LRESATTAPHQPLRTHNSLRGFGVMTVHESDSLKSYQSNGFFSLYFIERVFYRLFWCSPITQSSENRKTQLFSYKQMSCPTTPSLSTLPIELVYRILDNLNLFDIVVSAYNVCTRLNSIIDSYHPYQVNLMCTKSRGTLITTSTFISPLIDLPNFTQCQQNTRSSFL